ncbi:MAG: ParA family protein [Desulfamplus sp.]|nr:ParA family protein [Desulfamplus sp.]
MKSIATINFKGGVGKTTVTWLLAKYAAEVQGKKILVVDTDAQMSLTTAVQLQESGALQKKFEYWYRTIHIEKKKTIINAIVSYQQTSQGKFFDFSVDDGLIYEMSPNLHLIPSTEDLFYLDMSEKNKSDLQNFCNALLEKIKSKYSYDYVFFDCPPHLNILSYSVIIHTDLVLTPVNPDAFAAPALRVMINAFQSMKLYKLIGIFLNKSVVTDIKKKTISKDTLYYFEEVKKNCNSLENKINITLVLLNSYLPLRVDIRDAIPGGEFPQKFEDDFYSLWKDLERISSISMEKKREDNKQIDVQKTKANEFNEKNKVFPLKVGNDWIELIVTGEPSIIITFKGYAPILPVKLKKSGLHYQLYISAKSIAECIEPLRKKNNGLFKNLEFSIRKASDDRLSRYEIKVN